MKTINSVSGGKTSSYMAIHYPADYDIFSLVCIDDRSCAPKDKRLTQMVNDKIEKSGCIDTHGEFIATAEYDDTLRAIFDLEQIIGREITWLRGISFDKLIEKRKSMPFMIARFCTQQMKMQVVGEWAVEEMSKPENMIDGVPQLFLNNVGIRHDEENRVKKSKEDRWLDVKIQVGWHPNGNRKWETKRWGVVNYPLYNDKIPHFAVSLFWHNYKGNILFPEDSNCVGCFYKHVEQLRKNWEDAPHKMEWFARQEREMKKKNKKARWLPKGPDYDTIKNLPMQLDFFYGGGAGCMSGFCTD